jgi:hypothetical protein
MPMTEDYLHFPGSATVGEALQAYVAREGQWWWLLVAETEGEFSVCSFGSLLPYLTGRTEHIVHNIGDCAICCSMDPVLWQETGRLVQEALADAAACSRRVADLPLAALPVVETQGHDEAPLAWWGRRPAGRAVGVIKNGVLEGVDILQVKGDLGGMGGPPDF